ncbi:uncharacterized protein [Elaeis guineensis]|uniref:Uncharacterized protein LOC105060835 isoform X3 n=1 Tax=Elaeis guineensis var. tenera TaxID=51953 RepID=A0A6I9SHL4_ELAGV|nr:uncharacterized protein LOC105060835 isoform X3 [Elaeis guineensis]
MVTNTSPKMRKKQKNERNREAASVVAMGGGRGVDVIHSCPIRPPPSRRCPAKNPLPSKDANPRELQITHTPLCSKAPRRDALLLFALPALLPSLADSSSAAAFSLGIPGPKDWLRDQKKKAARFILAPIEDSRESLRNAYLLLSSEAGSPVEDSGEVRRLLNLAVKDCVPQRRSSLVEFQSRTGVEVCTFRLLVKNAASLLDKGDPVKLDVEAMLNDLIRSFSLLGSVIDSSNFEFTTDRGQPCKVSGYGASCIKSVSPSDLIFSAFCTKQAQYAPIGLV